jgi:hypothetical protein
MKFLTSLAAASILLISHLHGQAIDNADFSKGRTGWQGDGKVIYIAADGTLSDRPSPDTTPALRIDLSKNDWREIHQRLSAKAAESEISYSVQVMAAPAFVRLPESKKYTSDFSEGGTWYWTNLVYPKCDFLIRVKDGGWHYRPFSLAPVGQWKSYSATFSDLKERKRELALLFPPGTGYVLLKGK